MVEAGSALGWVTTGVGSVPGRWDEIQLAGQFRTTYVTVGIGFHDNYRQFH